MSIPNKVFKWIFTIWFFICYLWFFSILLISTSSILISFLFLWKVLLMMPFSKINGFLFHFYTMKSKKVNIFCFNFLVSLYFLFFFFFCWYFSFCFFSLDILWYLFLPYYLFLFFSHSDKFLYLSLTWSVNLSLSFL